MLVEMPAGLLWKCFTECKGTVFQLVKKAPLSALEEISMTGLVAKI